MSVFEGLPEGATPLDPEEQDDLIPTFLRTKAQLDEWEQANILDAEMWLFSPRTLRKFQVSREWLLRVHHRMFSQVWRWAGHLRTTERNIGIDPQLIGVAMRDLCDDVAFWMEAGTYPLDEAAARLHHRLVAIHPFPNGNGRHARMVADALLAKEGAPRFTWGRDSLYANGEVRRRYIAALRAADGHDTGPLLEFVRS